MLCSLDIIVDIIVHNEAYLSHCLSLTPTQVPHDLDERVSQIEVMLGMVLRLPEGAGKKARFEAFKGRQNI